MRMRKILSSVLAMVLLASCVLLAIVPASASPAGTSEEYKELFEGDNELTKDELVDAILSHMLEEGALQIDELRDAAHVYVYWNVGGVGMPKEITDSADRTVTIYKPIKRIILPNGDCMPLMRALRATDKIVGVSKYTIEDTLFYPEFGDYSNIGSLWSPNYEVMVGCEPDAVILYAAFGKSNCEAIENTLSDANPDITFIWIDGYKPSSQVEEARILGYLLDKEEEAEEWIDFYEGFLNPIYDEVAEIPEENRTKVYIECWRAYHTAAGNSGWHEKIELVGGYNIFREETVDYPDVGAEAVIKGEPEVIIRAAKTEGGYDTNDITELSNLRDEIMGRKELAIVPAVNATNESVYVINNDIFGGTGHFVGMGYVAKWLYPDLFSNLDPKAAHRRYLTEFQGLSDSLVDNGVFVYPEPS
ncbi:hypothetical protein ES705_30133 [subsurface metagenome]